MANEAGKGSKPRPLSVPQDVFDERFDLIFGKKNKKELPIDKEWDQMKPVGKEVLPEYELDDGQLTDEQYAKIKELAEYELNKSTGDVQLKADE